MTKKNKLKLDFKIYKHENGIEETKYMINKNQLIRCSKCNNINKSPNDCWWFTCGVCNYSIKQSIYKNKKKNNLLEYLAEIALKHDKEEVLI